uniref:Uncharacterized protein n=1 Tax=viral metagenome TaxID=1070528 RepID=A0A6C0JPL8_9ZZZZ
MTRVYKNQVDLEFLYDYNSIYSNCKNIDYNSEEYVVKNYERYKSLRYVDLVMRLLESYRLLLKYSISSTSSLIFNVTKDQQNLVSFTIIMEELEYELETENIIPSKYLDIFYDIDIPTTIENLESSILILKDLKDHLQNQPGLSNVSNLKFESIKRMIGFSIYSFPFYSNPTEASVEDLKRIPKKNVRLHEMLKFLLNYIKKYTIDEKKKVDTDNKAKKILEWHPKTLKLDEILVSRNIKPDSDKYTTPTRCQPVDLVKFSRVTSDKHSKPVIIETVKPPFVNMSQQCKDIMIEQGYKYGGIGKDLKGKTDTFAIINKTSENISLFPIVDGTDGTFTFNKLGYYSSSIKKLFNIEDTKQELEALEMKKKKKEEMEDLIDTFKRYKPVDMSRFEKK